MGSGGNQVGQISGQASGDATRLGGMSVDAMARRYEQLGLGGQGAQPSGPTVAGQPGVPGSGYTPVTPGQFNPGGGTTGGTPGGGGSTFGGFGHTVSEIQPGGGGGGTPGVPTGGPTAFEMDAGVQPSWTGGIPQEFQAALGEAQFQDLGQTTSAAVGSQQAKGQTLSGIGQIGGLLGGI